jgi:hypothetical protein
VFRKVRGEHQLAALDRAMAALAFPASLLAMLADRDAAPAVATATVLVTAVKEQWATTGDAQTYASATAAHQSVRAAGTPFSVALPAADLASPVTLVGV